VRSSTLETLVLPGWMTSSTNCLRASRRLAMNLWVLRGRIDDGTGAPWMNQSRVRRRY
jgi:hypothetical protein